MDIFFGFIELIVYWWVEEYVRISDVYWCVGVLKIVCIDFDLCFGLFVFICFIGNW